MNMRLKLILLTSILLLSRLTFAAEPRREDGLSAHVLPKSVAELDKEGNLKYGFMVSQAHDLKAPLERPVFQTAEELVAYFSKQSKTIQENGFWVVVTNPNAYSDEEKQTVENLKVLCRRQKIPLFICRGMDLPNGWIRQN